MIVDYVVAKGFADTNRTLAKRMMISPTFFGFDQPVHHQPNLVVTGPIMKADTSELNDRLHNKN